MSDTVVAGDQTRPMTLIERLRNPAFVTNPNGGDALLDVKQTRSTMDEAAEMLEAFKAMIPTTMAARARNARS